ncbi:MAG: hypothetical protein JJ927_05075 [Balneola sp.]|nr:hypothetical protein [Balneola sp.]
MIKFFRKIRQKFLSESKFSKYLVYAIGEVFLVMIGILLAFQVNQWNESRKGQKLETDLLSEMRESLKEYLRQLTYVQNFQERINDSQNAFIAWLDDEDLEVEDINMHIAKTLYLSEFLPRNGPYETMKQLGLKKINNDSLRAQIIFLYEVRYNHYADFLAMYRIQVNKFGPYFESYLNEVNYFDFDVMRINNTQQMKADKKLRFNVATLQNIGEQLPLMITPGTISSVETTLKMLEKELEE